MAGDVVDLEVVQAPASPFAEFVGLNLTITQTVSTVPPLARYTHGPGIDEPLIMERDLDSSGAFENGEGFYYQADVLGSVTGLTDSVGAVAQAYVYDSFGQIVQQLVTLPNPYTYTGREFDEETGLYFYRARYYDANMGRFLTEDPIRFLAGDINLYSYVGNAPTNLVDPLGLAGIGDVFRNPKVRAVGTFGLSILVEETANRLPPGKARGAVRIAGAALNVEAAFLSTAVSAGSFVVAFTVPVNPAGIVAGVLFGGFAIINIDSADEPN